MPPAGIPVFDHNERDDVKVGLTYLGLSKGRTKSGRALLLYHAVTTGTTVTFVTALYPSRHRWQWASNRRKFLRNEKTGMSWQGLANERADP